MIGMNQSDACSHWGLGLVSVRWRRDRIRREVEWGLGRGEGEKARGEFGGKGGRRRRDRWEVTRVKARVVLNHLYQY